MSEHKILHVMILDKFLASYIEFIDKNFGRDNHHYVFITSEKYEYGLTPEHKVEFLHTDDDIFITLLKYMKMAKKIILHGLWRDKVDILLYFNKKLLKKCYWVMWGGDFYFPEKQTWFRHKIIKNVGYLVSGTTGDYELVKKCYGSRGKHIKCFNYPSNLYKAYKTESNKNNIINIQLGNSATETNNHMEILDSLSKYKDKNIQIFVPLSYGDKIYAKKVEIYGQKIFGNKFITITEFMPFEKYLKFLSTIDIAIFAHKRQQAMGNIITLLGLGKKVYLDPISTLNGVFEEYNIKVFNSDKIDLSLLDIKIKENNINSVKFNFSKEVLIQSLSSWIK
ncbi:TDP-N-acetylfucosamine:lipid II N-acetylfucosaminyltransferase [Aliarcobacter skirrowii]|uniref:TDP-N-acetylfucosamine:lipid II N-acetylfucosaminyltransferase n=1 Tax=Aliarcobacter skirrowii TaxID=28200 RepID=UPI0029BE97F9|nr:TDP-N-acetylfucosamine:lipid II N-acetylfucosaminyltransferase [Aliarcobacter skirrowii]MDX4036492.1 TDP-N-acetylfucosamine:lipid II N-acetylfucosaminyltransferase [Aliarcobacter skirrowii]